MQSELDNDSDLEKDEGNGDGYEAKIGHLIVAVLHDDSLDLKAKRKKILKALQLMDEPAEAPPEDEEGDETAELDDDGPADDEGDEETDGDETPDEKDESVEWARVFRTHRDPDVRRLAERFDRMQVRERLRGRRARARQLCRRASLPPAVVSRLFVDQLLHAPDEQAMLALIEDRRRLAGVRVPRSASPGAGTRMDVKEFANHLRRGA